VFAIAIGFALAGLCASGYRLFRMRLPSFRRLEVEPLPAPFAAIPLLPFSTPFLIMRNTLRVRRLKRHRAGLIIAATVLAGLWSLAFATVVGDCPSAAHQPLILIHPE
jgi:hypothetical protein